jgi:hypothetical protein
MNKHYIYFHKREDDGVIFYVGIGVGRRAYRESNRSEFWKRVVEKHGYNIEFPHTNISQEQAKQLEIHYISVYGRMDKGTGTLCNMTDGGDGRAGYKCTEETKEKMRKSATGVKFTEDRKKKIGEKSIERKAWLSASEKNKKPVICDEVWYESQSALAKHIGISVNEVRVRCLSKRYPKIRFA